MYSGMVCLPDLHPHYLAPPRTTSYYLVQGQAAVADAGTGTDGSTTAAGSGTLTGTGTGAGSGVGGQTERDWQSMNVPRVDFTSQRLVSGEEESPRGVGAGRGGDGDKDGDWSDDEVGLSWNHMKGLACFGMARQSGSPHSLPAPWLSPHRMTWPGALPRPPSPPPAGHASLAPHQASPAPPPAPAPPPEAP